MLGLLGIIDRSRFDKPIIFLFHDRILHAEKHGAADYRRKHKDNDGIYQVFKEFYTSEVHFLVLLPLKQLYVKICQ